MGVPAHARAGAAPDDGLPGADRHGWLRPSALPPHGYTRPRYSRFLGALVEHLSVPEVYLLGHSHGGFVTQYHALHHPERVAG